MHASRAAAAGRESRLLRELLAPTLFIVAILGTNYALAGLPNVKLFDLLVFVAGYSLGARRGAVVAVGAWLVYGTVNPWGMAQAPLLLTLMGAEVGYALAGATVHRFVSPERVTLGPSKLSIALIASAVLATLAFDLVTNLYTAFFWAGLAGSTEYGRWVATTLFGPGALLFMVMHVASNAVLFPVFGPLFIKVSRRHS